MAEFEEKLNAILGNPEAMGQIASLAQALSGGGSAGGTEAPAEEESPEEPAPPASSGGGPAQDAPLPDLGALLGLLGGGDAPEESPSPGGLNPRLIQTALTLFSEYNAADDRKVALLSALKPFVRPERYAKVDRAIRIAKLSRVIRTALRLFQEGGEGDV